MAICSLSRDLLRTTSCGYSLPQVNDIYIANMSDVITASTASTSGGCETISAITLDEGATFYHIEPAKNSTTFTDELVVEDNGNKYRTHTLSFSLSNKYDACLHDDFDALSLGRYFVVVRTADDTYLALGRVVGMEASVATLSGGGDTNGIQITLTANVTESAIPLNDDAISDVLGN